MNVENTEGIARWRAQIDALDEEIAVRLADRVSLSRRIQQTRMEIGGSRVAADREREVVGRYAGVLGEPGVRLANLILDISRGALNRDIARESAGGSR